MLATLTFHHIGVATHNIAATAEMYVRAGYKCSDTVVDPLQNVEICFLYKEGMPTVELISPLNENSPVVKTLVKCGVTPYHCCYVTRNMQQDISELKKQKYMLVSKPQVACALGNKHVAFLFHKDVGLIELLES